MAFLLEIALHKFVLEPSFRLHRSASKRRTRRDIMKTGAHNKLTFCISVGERPSPPHDNCYPNWHHFSSDLESVCGTSSDGGDSASTLVSLDMWRLIFLRFPAKSVVQFRAVCRDWKAVIDEPCFVKAVSDNNKNTLLVRNKTGPPFHPLYSIKLDELDFTKALQKISVTRHEEFTGTRFPCLPVSGCNGLMLIVDDNKKLQLWNPLTDEHLELPPPAEEEEECNSEENVRTRVSIGLGYDEATNDYKVVVIHWDQKERVYRTHVYSLRSDSWKMIVDGDFSCGGSFCHPVGPSVFLCGALHWFSQPWRSETKIAVLDVRTERYRQIQGPHLRTGSRSIVAERNTYLGVLGGCLVVADLGLSDDEDHYDLWVMKEYGSEDSWTKLINFTEHHFVWEEQGRFCCRGQRLRPLTYLNNKTQILLEDEKGFYLHDVESDSITNVICIHGLIGDLSSQIFAGTIFRLHENCGVSGKRRTRKRKRNMKRPPADTELFFCVKDIKDVDTDDFDSHDSCHAADSNWYCSSSENED